MKFRKMKTSDYDSIVEIANLMRITDDSKRGWFTKDACETLIPLEIRIHKGYVAEEDGILIGFITYTSFDYRPIIGWIAIRPDNHRRGVGARLLKLVENRIRKIGGKELFLETPSKETGMGTEYEKTYKFYEGMGFTIVRIKKRDAPDNQCGCDMAVMRKVLG